MAHLEQEARWRAEDNERLRAENEQLRLTTVTLSAANATLLRRLSAESMRGIIRAAVAESAPMHKFGA